MVMKPSFNFLDLLPIQLLGGLGIGSALLGYAAGGLWLFLGATIGVVLVIFALRTIPVR
jgi:hypothetical protein